MEKKLKQTLSDLRYDEIIEDESYRKEVDNDLGKMYIIDLTIIFDSPIIQCYFYKDNQRIMSVCLDEPDIKNAEMYLQYMWETLKLGYYELY